MGPGRHLIASFQHSTCSRRLRGRKKKWPNGKGRSGAFDLFLGKVRPQNVIEFNFSQACLSDLLASAPQQPESAAVIITTGHVGVCVQYAATVDFHSEKSSSGGRYREITRTSVVATDRTRSPRQSFLMADERAHDGKQARAAGGGTQQNKRKVPRCNRRLCVTSRPEGNRGETRRDGAAIVNIL